MDGAARCACGRVDGGASSAATTSEPSRAGKFGVGYVGVCGIKQFGGVSCAHKQRRFPLRFVP